MLAMLACHCASAPNKAYSFLQEHHISRYMAVPLLQGDKAKSFAKAHSSPELFTYIDNHSSYVIVVGYDSLSLEWEDINNAPEDILIRAELLLSRFA